MAILNRKIVKIGTGAGLLLLGILILRPVAHDMVKIAQTYQEAPFQEEMSNRIVEKLERKQLSVDKSGRVDLRSIQGLNYGSAYVTLHPGGSSFEVLLPSYREHDSNVLLAYTYSRTHLSLGQSIRVRGPWRGSSSGPCSRLLTLTVDRQLSPGWYHVHGAWGITYSGSKERTRKESEYAGA